MPESRFNLPEGTAKVRFYVLGENLSSGKVDRKGDKMNNNDGLKLSYLMESWRIKLTTTELNDTYVRVGGASASGDAASSAPGKRESARLRCWLLSRAIVNRSARSARAFRPL